MTNRYVNRLIRQFFGQSVSEETQAKFRRWLTDGANEADKQEAMYAVWEQAVQAEDTRTPAALAEIHRRINRHKPSRSLSPYTRIARIAALFLLPLLGAASMYFLKPDREQVREPELTECFVPYGRQEHLVLPDGSEVWVNAGSMLIYGKTFDGPTRTVYLNGEANFEVAPDPAKPFIVRTAYLDIEALGTTFNVQAYPEADCCTATLERGKIRVDARQDGGRSFILCPDEQVVYTPATRYFVKQTVDASKNSRWKLGYLVFQGNTLDEMMRAIERRFGVQVSYHTDRFARRTFTIRFSPDESLPQILDVMADLVGFRYRIKGNSVYIH